MRCGDIGHREHSEQRKGRRIPHTSVAELKSARNRYILDEAIVIKTSEDIKNICIARTHEELVFPITHSSRKNKTYHVERI